ncbi:hypothetical protein SAMN02745174_00475 [Cetobacterium ceti]|uniref:DUF4015 domain-containing protein n=2 Tax=Cetobacterium ceti TaxID=180163 RepID=A0A1T4KKM6_9FUSO|nr:putative glycoside hydrolase [Cetobacterium ceti]SJZ42955.1 hypothetical protein SAMN02745174_00475 [Cetobacterium ceti]
MRIRSKKRFSSFLTIIVCLFVGIIYVSFGHSKPKEPLKVKEEIKLDLFSQQAHGAEISEMKKVPEKLLVEQEIKKESIKKNYHYVNSHRVRVYDNLKDKKVIDTLSKGTRVSILKREKIEKYTWIKVKYINDLKDKEGWIRSDMVSDSLKDTLPKSWSGLDFNYNKGLKEYANNPRVDVKGIYLNIYTMGSERKLNKLIKLANTSEINAFVIDVKDDNGTLLWKMPGMEKYNPRANKYNPIKDIEPIMKKLKENNIYTIARIVSFKDPNYAKSNPDKAIIKKETGKPFTNSDGIIWVSPHDRNLWAYNIAVAEQAAKVGFNEVQFDYVRFPASNGGKLDKFLDYRNVANESKPETIQKYLKYARKKLSPLGVYISADTYGQIGTFSDDMGLGQYWEAMSSVVDYMCPMQYPSHYGQGAYGIKVPDANPYKTIYYSTRDSINRNENIDHPAIVRPWIQAFTATWVKGHINYGPKQIQEQVKAMKDLGVNEYLLWSPSNNYKL